MYDLHLGSAFESIYIHEVFKLARKPYIPIWWRNPTMLCYEQCANMGLAE